MSATRDASGFDQFDDFDAIGQHFARALADQRQALRGGWAREDLGQFRKPRPAVVELDVLALGDGPKGR